MVIRNRRLNLALLAAHHLVNLAPMLTAPG